MKKIKQFFHGVGDVITAVIGVTIVTAWVITILNITYGLAIWSTKWLWGLI